MLGWAVAEIFSQLFCRQEFYRLPSCRLCSGGIFETSVLEFHLRLCTLFMVANVVGEHKTREKGGRPSVACTTNSGSKVLILEWKMRSEGRGFFVKQEKL